MPRKPSIQRTPEELLERYNAVAKKTRKLSRKSVLKRHGFTLDTYEAKFVEQEGKCAVCGDPPTVAKRRTALAATRAGRDSYAKPFLLTTGGK